MLHEYFTIIRAALKANRSKKTAYYEAHHIVPKSFGKKSFSEENAFLWR